MNQYERGGGDGENDADSEMIILALAVGMKMVADLKQFSGVNEKILKETILVKKTEIETKLRDTNRLRVFQIKKVNTSHSFVSLCDGILSSENNSSEIGLLQLLDKRHCQRCDSCEVLMCFSLFLF